MHRGAEGDFPGALRLNYSGSAVGMLWSLALFPEGGQAMPKGYAKIAYAIGVTMRERLIPTPEPLPARIAQLLSKISATAGAGEDGIQRHSRKGTTPGAL
jgi:hypothetical protein